MYVGLKNALTKKKLKKKNKKNAKNLLWIQDRLKENII